MTEPNPYAAFIAREKRPGAGNLPPTIKPLAIAPMHQAILDALREHGQMDTDAITAAIPGANRGTIASGINVLASRCMVQVVAAVPARGNGTRKTWGIVE